MRNLTTQETPIARKAHGTRVLSVPNLPATAPPSHHITPPHEELLKTILRPGAQSSRPKLAWRSLITARAVRRHSQTSTESESCPLSPSLICWGLGHPLETYVTPPGGVIQATGEAPY
ncbi:hypothetical protein CSPX01_01171 [Colletotrichum filicis]|nr:hypothetical protein CSPX01_01171 [Colletotrichum filicis]